MIKLQKGIKVSLEEKTTNITTDNVDVFESTRDLYQRYLKKIINNSGKRVFQNYNEFIFNDQIKLFIDIDLTVKEYNEEKKFTNFFEANKKKIKGTKESYILENFIEEIVMFLGKTLNTTLSRIEGENVKNEINGHIFTRDKYFENILKKVSVTLSNNPDKFSLHIFFNNLIFDITQISEIKNLIKNFQKKSKNPLSDYIDTIVYRNNSMLRFIYSTKEDSNYIHAPIECDYTICGLDIDTTAKEIDENEIQNYLFNIIDFDSEYFLINFTGKKTDTKEKEILFTLDAKTSTNIVCNIADTKILTSNDVLRIIFGEKKLALYQQYESIKNIDSFDNTIISELTEPLLIDFDYTKSVCWICKKKYHKNPHEIFFNDYGIVIAKRGVSAMCTSSAYLYPPLTVYKLCEWIYKKDVVKRLENGDIITFSDNYGWNSLEAPDYSFLKNMVSRLSHNFKQTDITNLHNMNEKTMMENFKSISKTDIPIKLKTHFLFKFRNGVLDISNNEFYKMEDSKHLYVINGVDYDYVKEEDYSDEEKKNHDDILNIINQIIPEYINDIYNNDRKVLENNLASCILTQYKDVITVFVGQTSSGKSTIKKLIMSVLTATKCIELPVSVYTELYIATKPHPWLGKIKNKLASFASEPKETDKLYSQNFKLLTEPFIQARQLLSNDQNQENFLTQFIDTNFPARFDMMDLATLRRHAVINFRTCFKTDQNKDLLSTDTRDSYEGHEFLKDKIMQGTYSLVFFNILKNWAIKHNLTKDFKMINTSEFSDYTLFNKIFNNLFIISTEFSDLLKIKKDVQENYAVHELLSIQNKTPKVIKCLSMDCKYLEGKIKNIIANYELDIDCKQFLKKLQLNSKSNSSFPFVLLSDVKDEEFDNILEIHNNKLRKNKSVIDKVFYEKYKDSTEITDELTEFM